MSEVSPPTVGSAPPPPAAGSPSTATGDTGSSSTQEAKDQAKDKANEVAGQAQEKAQQAAGQAKSRARDEIDRRSTEAGEQVSTTASDLRSVSEQLREQGKDQPAKIADQAAEKVEQLGGYLKDADADRILGDVEDYARRQPWAVVAGGVVLGIAAARFLKASSSQRYQQRSALGSGSSGNGAAGANGSSDAGRVATPGQGLGNADRPYVDPGTAAGTAGTAGTPLTTGVTPASGAGH
jgi:hypothetical protein